MRVENGSMPGTPDVNICQDGREFWVELKDVDDFPKRDTTPVFGREGLRPDQILWITQRVRAQGEVYILGRVKNETFCIPGVYAEIFNSLTRSGLEERNLDYRKILGLDGKKTHPLPAQTLGSP
jgi:hypothetical protein